MLWATPATCLGRRTTQARASLAVLPLAAPTHCSCHTAELHLPTEPKQDLWARSSAAGGRRLRFPMNWTQWSSSVTQPLRKHISLLIFLAEVRGLFKTTSPQPPPTPQLLHVFLGVKFSQGTICQMLSGVTIFFEKWGPNTTQKLASRGKLSLLLTARIPNGTLAECKGATLGLLHSNLVFAGKANLNLTYHRG